MSGKSEFRVDTAKNRLYIKISGFFRSKDGPQALADLEAALDRLQPGFDTVTDLSEFVPGAPGATALLSKGGEMVAQIDLPLQPSVLQLAAGGETLGAVHGRSGVTVWNVWQSQAPLVQEFAEGDWQLVFSSSGALVIAGRAEAGYQSFGAADGRIVGPALGVRRGQAVGTMLARSEDETVVLTGTAQGMLRFWRAPDASTGAAASAATSGHPLWQPSADRVMIALPDTQHIAIGNPAGEVYILPARAGPADFEAMSRAVGYLGHRAAVTALRADAAGNRVASAAADTRIRVWDAESGEPLRVGGVEYNLEQFVHLVS